jgi:hypothetical protein
MIRFREWYHAKDENEAWGLKQAMLTIHNAAPTKTTESSIPQEQGRVTWLRPLDANGKPLVEHVSCPLAKLPATLEGKDWTRYEGLLHTDHAVREEFFLDREVAPTASRAYLMDFTYLYHDKQEEFEKFTRGKLFSDEEVYAEIGRPEDWTHRAGPSPQSRSEEQAAKVAEQLLACRSWVAPSWYEIDEDRQT